MKKRTERRSQRNKIKRKTEGKSKEEKERKKEKKINSFPCCSFLGFSLIFSKINGFSKRKKMNEKQKSKERRDQKGFYTRSSVHSGHGLDLIVNLSPTDTVPSASTLQKNPPKPDATKQLEKSKNRRQLKDEILL